MAELHKDFSPTDTSVFARSLIEDGDTALLGRLFPSTFQSSRFATWQEQIEPKNKNVALFRSHGAETDFGEMSGGSREGSQRLANLGLKMPYTEDDVVAVQEGVADEQSIVDRLTAEVTSAVMNAINRMRADAFARASYEIKGKDFQIPVKFERNPELVTTAPQLWSAAEADPILYIANLVDKVTEESGVRPTTIITSTKVATILRRQAVMFTYAAQDKIVPFISHDAVQEVFRSYGLPTLEIYDEVDYLGNRYLDENSIYLTSTTGIGRTVWGPSTAARSKFPKTVSANGLYVGVYHEPDADTSFVRSDATVLPVLENPNATAVSKVL